MREFFLLIAVFICLLAATAHAADLQSGAKVFDANCSECHRAEPGPSGRKGPNLYGVVGRQAGSVKDYVNDYSYEVQSADFQWTAERLQQYLAFPRNVLPSTLMKFKGLADENERRQLVEFLASRHN